MKIKKSIKTLLMLILLLLIGLWITRAIITRNKWLFFRIATISNSNKLIDKDVENLGGVWYVKPVDSLVYATPGIDDRGWNTERYLYIALLKSGKQFSWLRKHFKAPSGFNSDSVLLRLSLFDIQAQVYLNGHKIADSCFVYNRTICCYLPVQFLLKGKANLIAIRARSMMPNPANQLVTFDDEIVEILHPTVNLAGLWKFSTGDNPGWRSPMFNDSSFKTLYVPRYWDDQGYKSYDGIAWYRRTFTVPDSLRNKQLIFVAGKIDDFGEVYVNGTRIGGHLVHAKDISVTEWDTYNLYPFSGKLLGKKNVVAVRVLDNQLKGGIYQGPIGIMAMKDYLKFMNTDY